MEEVSRAPAAPPEDDEQLGWGVAILLAAAAVFAAVIGGRAAFRSATATTEWQAAVREQAKQAAGYVEDLRFAYTSEEPVAFLLTEAQFRSEELERVAAGLTGTDRSLVELEQAIQGYVASELGKSSTLFSDENYKSAEGFDVGRRLADLRNEHPDLVAVDPEVAQAAGDQASEDAIRLVGSTTVVAAAFLFGSLAQGFRRMRQPFLIVGTVFLLAGVALAVVVEVAG